MLPNALATVIVAIAGVACITFNKSISRRFAINFAAVTKWIFPASLNPEAMFYIFYRFFFYCVALFFFVVAALMTVLLISNLR